MRIAHVDPFSGASGDMLLGAVLDAGAGLDELRGILSGLPVEGWRLDAETVTRGGLAATKAHVVVEVDDRPSRTWATVRGVLDDADLPEPVRRRALATFRRLAEAEARVHRRDVDIVHFHEVGAVDAIVDIVGACAGLWLLGVSWLSCAPVAQGAGMTRGAHGPLPVPAPAVLELLRGAPTYGAGVDVELCTPTGAALLAEWADRWGPLPAMTVDRVGYGAGTLELERPNLLRLVLAAPVPAAAVPGSTATRATDRPAASRLGGRAGRALLLETTVDDLPGELVPAVLGALQAAGAERAWVRQVLMKKGRPGLELVCVADPERGEALRDVLFRETTTLGVRGRLVDVWSR